MKTFCFLRDLLTCLLAADTSPTMHEVTYITAVSLLGNNMLFNELHYLPIYTTKYLALTRVTIT